MPIQNLRSQIKKKWPLAAVLLVVLALSACGSQPTEAPALPTPTQIEAQAAPTDIPTEQPTEAPTEPEAAATETSTEPSPIEAAEPAAQPLTLQIVPGESQVRYEVGETFINQNNRFNVAVGTTSQISGEVSLDPAAPRNSSIGPLQVDISQFRSDSDRRDNAIRGRFLQSESYPIATFSPTAIENLPDSYTPGEALSFQVNGDLTIRETTRPATFDVTARFDGESLTGTAETTLLMSDYGFGPISIAGILNTEDEVKLVMDFVAR